MYVSFPDENTPVEEYQVQPTIKMAIVEQKHKNRYSTLDFMISFLSSALIFLDA
jgi:hypothetical protein